MRDLLVTAIVFGSLPFILRRPWIGIIMWAWLSYMNPHKQAWGFATTMPFAMLVALATLVGMLFLKEPKKIPWTPEAKTLAGFVVWMIVTTVFALNPDGAYEQLDKVLKIQLMTFVTLMLINTELRLKVLIWIIALSIGYYGVKGGIFTIVHGGVHRVQGPTGTFIAGNNEMALAMIITIPLMRFLQLAHRETWVRLGLGGAMLLTAIAAIGSQSRGAFLAIGAMAVFLWLKSRNKITTGILVGVATAAVLAIMPPQYYERLATIQEYQQDGSAMGRINAWWFAWNLAKARPLLGGGFETFRPWLFDIYAPDPARFHDVHSIYFEVLGEHGFVGLGLFLLLGFLTWRSASRIKRTVAGKPESAWMGDLASMVQVSLVGYAVGGAFLGLAYFDLPYHLVAAIVICRVLLERAGQQVPEAVGTKPASVADGTVRPDRKRIGRRMQPSHPAEIGRAHAARLHGEGGK